MNWIILAGSLSCVFVIGSAVIFVLSIKRVGNVEWGCVNALWYLIWWFCLGPLWLTILISMPSKRTALQEFHNTRQMIELVVENGSDYDNIAISSTIIKTNTWLAGAKAGRERWGNWSFYPKEVETTDYIILSFE